MQDSHKQLLHNISGKRIFLPIIIGLLVVSYMLYKDIQVDKLRINAVNFTSEVKWYALEETKSLDTIICAITDTLVSQRDTIQFDVQYLIGNKKGVVQYQDRITIFQTEKRVEISNANHLKNIEIKANDHFVFLFDKPVENIFSLFKVTWFFVTFMLLALFMMVLRDIGYMVRIRILSNKQLTWLQSFRVIMLWEFTSAVTPSAVGGTSIATLYVHKEGLNLGRSTAVVLATSFLDEIYFVIFSPFLLLIVGASSLFVIGSNASTETALSFQNEFFYFAMIGYLLKLFYVLFISYGLFYNPRGMKWILIKIFKIRFLRRWRYDAAKVGTDLVISSVELKNQDRSFWLKTFGATVVSWTARYWIVNMLLLAFFGVRFFSFGDHFLIFARQFGMWIMMLVSPTPGGSGFAEFIFSRYLSEFIPLAGAVVALAMIWRIITYYPYLFVGAFIFPRWIKKKFVMTGKQETTEK